MNTNELKFYIIKLLISRLDIKKWTAQEVKNEIETISPDITIKQVRAFLNNLEESEILVSTTEGRDKYYQLSENMGRYEFDSSDLSVSEDGLAVLWLGLLRSIGESSNLVKQAKILENRLISSYDQIERIRLLEKNVERFRYGHSAMQSISEEMILNMIVLFENQCKKLELNLVGGNISSFQFEKIVIRNDVPICVGFDHPNTCYAEHNLDQVKSVEVTDEPISPIPGWIQVLIDISGDHIGIPSEVQYDVIKIQFDDESALRFKKSNLSTEFTWDDQNNIATIYHAPTEDVARWIISLSPGVKVLNSPTLEQKVSGMIDRIKASLSVS